MIDSKYNFLNLKRLRKINYDFLEKLKNIVGKLDLENLSNKYFL